jgi:hypothetical protein
MNNPAPTEIVKMDISFTGISDITSVFEYLSIGFTSRLDVQQDNN